MQIVVTVTQTVKDPFNSVHIWYWVMIYIMLNLCMFGVDIKSMKYLVLQKNDRRLSVKQFA